MPFPPILLKGQRVHVRPPKAEDMAEWLKLRDENRAYLEPLEPQWEENCLSEEFYKKKIKQQSHDWWEDKHYAFVILHLESNALIGAVNLNFVARGSAQYSSIGYWIAEKHQGQGLMRESLEAVMDFAHKGLRLHRLNAATLVHNERSQKLLERLGFEREGLARQYIEINGAWQDHILFGKVF